jgi:L-histidine N-alpha-methyltransferase
MHLVADEPQRVRVAGLGDLELDLADGDWIRTEISTKFTAEGVAAELAAAGLDPVDCWSDPGGDFLLTLARPR